MRINQSIIVEPLGENAISRSITLRSIFQIMIMRLAVMVFAYENIFINTTT